MRRALVAAVALVVLVIGATALLRRIVGHGRHDHHGGGAHVAARPGAGGGGGGGGGPGGPQQYTEINAFEQGVNLFVATGDGNELPYVYRDGTGLEAPPAPQPAEGTPFATAGVPLDVGARLPSRRHDPAARCRAGHRRAGATADRGAGLGRRA